MTSEHPTSATEPVIITLFGATGDLAKRMVLPAFWELHARKLLPSEWRLIGNGRGEVSDEEFRTHVRESLREFGPGELDPNEWDTFASRLRFAGHGFTADDPGQLLEVVAATEKEVGVDASRIQYLAVPPVAFEPTVRALDAHDLIKDSRVVFEKPYGTSLPSFEQLDQLVHSVMQEDQVYRIDHFLGKEAVQNLHVLRFVNRMIGAVWSSAAIEQVQIDVPETLGVADRAGFYDATGAFRDMIATHLFQVASEVAMEAPLSLEAADMQRAREEVLAKFRPLDPSEAVFGQFDGYRDLPDVPDDSTTDTFAAVRLWVDTDRWRGVPFILRSAKRMHRSLQQISLLLRPTDGPYKDAPRSILKLAINGAGSFSATLTMKEPGPDLTLTQVPVEVHVADLGGTKPLPPYVSLLHDVVIGDRTLFTTGRALDFAWTAAQPILDNPPTPLPYAPGSWGPAEADKLTDGHGWIAQEAPVETDGEKQY